MSTTPMFRQTVGTLCAIKGKHPGMNLQDLKAGLCVPVNQHDSSYIRRLTPVEAERLMGWPDGWTEFGIDDNGNKVRLADTNRYAICGNGIVANVTEWIGRRLAEAFT